MATIETMRQLMKKGCPVYYFYSTEGYLVRRESAHVMELLSQGETEQTILDDPAPDIESIVMAAGTISFFGTRRLVEMPNLEPAAYSDADIDALCDTLASTENAVFVLSTVFKTEKDAQYLSKRMQKLVDTCKKVGYVESLSKPTAAQLQQMIVQRAAATGTNLSDAVAKTMVERTGEDAYLLENETDKLCALAGYKSVSAGMVAQVGVAQLDAKIYDLINPVTAKNSTAACKKLHELLLLQNEPIVITASLNGSYVDMYRVKLGQATRRNYNTVFKDFGYKGKPFRLKYALDAASRYTIPQLEQCLLILLELDQALKGSPVDATVLMETAICRLCAAGSRL